MKNYFTRILVTGGLGQLGSALFQHAKANYFNVKCCSHAEFDINSLKSIQHYISAFQPDIIINTAAYTAVDKAEKEIAAAMKINYIGAKNLALWCQANHVPLIHLSTDYIFDGKNTSGYEENDSASPLNVYGKSKYLGEQAVRRECAQHIILRVSGIFSEFGNNFFKTILKLAQEKHTLRVVSDQITCPTYAGHIASVIYAILMQQPKWGTYHYCDTTPVSWHTFASVIMQEAKLHRHLSIGEIKAITSHEYSAPAKRPAASVLNCQKIFKDYGVSQFSWLSVIKELTEKLCSQK